MIFSVGPRYRNDSIPCCDVVEVLAVTPTKSRSDGAQLIKTCDWFSLEIKAPVTPYIARIRYIQ